MSYATLSRTARRRLRQEKPARQLLSCSRSVRFSRRRSSSEAGLSPVAQERSSWLKGLELQGGKRPIAEQCPPRRTAHPLLKDAARPLLPARLPGWKRRKKEVSVP